LCCQYSLINYPADNVDLSIPSFGLTTFQEPNTTFFYYLVNKSINLILRTLSLKFSNFIVCIPLEKRKRMTKDKHICVNTAKRKLERLQFSTSSFVKIWSACSCEFNAYFWTFWALYHLLFDLDTIGVN
jgi:hypothetical protein